MNQSKRTTIRSCIALAVMLAPGVDPFAAESTPDTASAPGIQNQAKVGGSVRMEDQGRHSVLFLHVDAVRKTAAPSAAVPAS